MSVAVLGVLRVVDRAQVLSPGADGADVQVEGGLARRRGERERMVLALVEAQAGDSNPLARQVVKVAWLLELQVSHTTGQLLGLVHDNFHLCVLGQA